MTGRQAWTQRLTIASYALHIFALLTAVVASGVPDGFDGAAILAALIAGIGTSAAFFARLPFPERSTREVVVLAVGVACFSIASGLTGGFASTYTLMPIATIFLAAVGGGMTAAIPTSALAIVGVAVASVAAGPVEVTGSLIRIPAFYLLTALAFSEVRRAVFDQEALAANARFVGDTADDRRVNLEATHDLLEDLVRVATSPAINAVATAQDAIRDIGVGFPAVTTRIISSSGTVLAHRGTPPDRPPDIVVTPGSEPTAPTLEVWSDDDVTEAEVDMLTDAMRPVQLAIENDQMVSTVAGTAVQRERVRLARELHDDIAPSVASVGLTLDMLLAGGRLDGEQERTISATRENISTLVNRIRAQVQDLRAERTRSLTDYAHSLVAEVESDGPTVIVSIDERVPPRPAAADEVRAILTEAFRNSLNHAQATVIKIEGHVDEDGGDVSVTDNGCGFDPVATKPNRFGLVGMRERGSIVDAEVSITSEPGNGTVVSIHWSNTP